jgi:hypothetical protein
MFIVSAKKRTEERKKKINSKFSAIFFGKM